MGMSQWSAAQPLHVGDARKCHAAYTQSLFRGVAHRRYSAEHIKRTFPALRYNCRRLSHARLLCSLQRCMVVCACWAAYMYMCQAQGARRGRDARVAACRTSHGSSACAVGSARVLLATTVTSRSSSGEQHSWRKRRHTGATTASLQEGQEARSGVGVPRDMQACNLQCAPLTAF